MQLLFWMSAIIVCIATERKCCRHKWNSNVQIELIEINIHLSNATHSLWPKPFVLSPFFRIIKYQKWMQTNLYYDIVCGVSGRESQRFTPAASLRFATIALILISKYSIEVLAHFELELLLRRNQWIVNVITNYHCYCLKSVHTIHM